MSKYIIINAEAIQKRIKKLYKSEHLKSKWVHDNDRDNIEIQISILEGILSQSTPLIPEIEKAFDSGCKYGDSNCETGGKSRLPNKVDYISNLKLTYEKSF